MPIPIAFRKKSSSESSPIRLGGIFPCVLSDAALVGSSINDLSSRGPRSLRAEGPPSPPALADLPRPSPLFPPFLPSPPGQTRSTPEAIKSPTTTLINHHPFLSS